MGKAKEQAKTESKPVESPPMWAKVKPEGVPSVRDMEIWRRVTIDRETQDALAKEKKLSPSRISRIVAKAARHVAMFQPYAGKDWNSNQQQAYSHQVAKLVLEKQLRDSVEGYRLSKTGTVTTRAQERYDYPEEGKKVLKSALVSRVEKTVPQGDFRFLGHQLKLVEAIQRNELAVAQIPVPKRAYYPEFDHSAWTSEEQAGLVQRLFRHWYNERQQKEAAKTGAEPKVWPEDEFIDTDGNGVREGWPAHNAHYAKRVAEGVHGDAPLGKYETASGVNIGEASEAAKAAAARQNPWWNGAPEPEPYISPNACCDGYREQLAQKGRQGENQGSEYVSSQEYGSSSVTTDELSPTHPEGLARQVVDERGDDSVGPDDKQATRRGKHGSAAPEQERYVWWTGIPQDETEEERKERRKHYTGLDARMIHFIEHPEKHGIMHNGIGRIMPYVPKRKRED